MNVTEGVHDLDLHTISSLCIAAKPVAKPLLRTTSLAFSYTMRPDDDTCDRTGIAQRQGLSNIKPGIDTASIHKTGVAS